MLCTSCITNMKLKWVLFDVGINLSGPVYKWDSQMPLYYDPSSLLKCYIHTLMYQQLVCDFCLSVLLSLAHLSKGFVIELFTVAQKGHSILHFFKVDFCNLATLLCTIPFQ